MATKTADRRVKTPTVLQMEAVECGAAALATVLGFHGRFVPLERLRIECGVSRDGSKASNVLKAARKYGMVAKGYRKELEGLVDIPLPAILFWNMNHFVVLEGFRKGRVYLNDPAEGPRVISMEDLDLGFSGVVLTFEPGPEFAREGQQSRMIPALRARLAGSERALLFVVLCGVFLVLPGLVAPTFTRVFIDEFLVGGRRALLKPLLFGMCLTALIQMGLTALQRRVLLRMETKLALVASSEFFLHLLRLPVPYFGQRYAGEIGSRVQLNDRVASMVSGQLATVALDSLLIVFYAGLMFVYDGLLTTVVIALALLNVAALRWASRRRTDVSRRLAQEDGKLMGTAINGLVMIETLKATGSETEFFSRWAGYQAKALKAEQEVGLVSEYVGSVPPMVRTLASTAVLLLGGLRVMDGALTIGMLVAYQSLLASFMRPLETLLGFGGALQALEADMGRLDDVLRHPEDPQLNLAAPEGEGRIKLSGQLELRDLSFGYNPLDPPLIEGFSLAVQPGQRVALVGASGSGKSTIARMVCGVLTPWSGQILFDGIERGRLDPKLISNSLALVDQDVFLFDGTVRENLTLWDLTVPVHNVTRAARDAAIDDVVQTRDGAYQAAVAQGGSNFSGGQRQRLEIARALVGDPTILILDEATSALDPATELAIDDQLRKRGCTCLIVAHRLSTIRDCDEIIVMERGKIVQRGTHDEMKGQDGPYARLIKE